MSKQLQIRRKRPDEREIAPPIVDEALRSGGAPLDGATGAFFEPRFEHDFSRVRVHTKEQAVQKQLHIIRRRESRPHEVQDKSWADWFGNKGHIASIFFSTKKSELDDNDRFVLGILYRHALQLLPSQHVGFRFVGYADHRGTAEYNYRLSLRRAKNVAAYFEELLGDRANYSTVIVGAGEQGGPYLGTTSEALSLLRRVDVFLEVSQPPVPSSTPEHPIGDERPRSKKWKARVVGSASGGYYLGGTFLHLEVVDLTNHLQMYYRYRGGLATAGPGVSWGLSSGSPGTDWQTFVTTKEICIEDFKGPALQGSAGAQFTYGPSIQYLMLLGPTIAGAKTVHLFWGGVLEEGYAGGAGGDVGPLEPVTRAIQIPDDYK
jgi:outer membrane protein OmpA-like peptidoglycan-associated protein